MKAALYYGQEDVRVETVDADRVGPGDVLVDVAACGICGSDLHEYTAGPIFVPNAPHPMTGVSLPLRMGHEFAGRISEVGRDVTNLSVGDTVTVNPIQSCGNCRFCAAGKRHLCASIALIGVSADGGGFAERSVIPAENVVPLPESVPPQQGALIEPFSVALHAVRRAELTVGDSVAVYGSGPIGLAIVQVLHAAGTTDVFVVEPRAARRELAGDFGAMTINPIESDAVRRVKAATDGGTDAAFEVAGIEQTYNAAISSTKRDGTVVVVSVFEDTVETHPNSIVMAERTVRGTMSYLANDRADGEFQAVTKMFADGQLAPDQLVTSVISLSDIVTGFESLRDPESDDIKILVEV
ncbi:2,3-butanediol dehydrogenase [Halomarina halobia]|uniref:2,3-butanediol dehydrogenase n=1 Tax=Halomarina halobia TaxID=3033386 RepID=A0ABD6AEY8_9EURY|nr:2,3-butanediol dehydrogenase [Halomarina sp. PSR21]